MPTALVTGASAGLGAALARELAARGWRLVLDARGADRLAALAADLGAVAVPGDVTDPEHRAALVAAVGDRLDLLVNNASELGPSPLPSVADLPLDAFRRILEVNVVAPLALLQALPQVAAIVNISSDAAVEAYPGWGGYGSSKAALDHLTAVLAAERPDLRVLSVDPGDMRTEMHRRAFPGEDISDRPLPEDVAPALLRLVLEAPSGRHRVAAEVTA